MLPGTVRTGQLTNAGFQQAYQECFLRRQFILREMCWTSITLKAFKGWRIFTLKIQCDYSRRHLREECYFEF